MMYKLISSANKQIEQPRFLTMSFIWIMKSNGPRIEPYGTPARTDIQSET